MPALAAVAASGWVSIERKRASDAAGSLASRPASPARICSAASAGVPLTSGTGAASITRRYSSCLDPIESFFAGPPGTPARLQGREAIREYSRRVMASPLRLEDFEVAGLYQTQDPEVVIVEMRTKGTVTTTGRPFTATSIQVLRIREGHIVLFRDFADPRGLEDVLGEPRPGS